MHWFKIYLNAGFSLTTFNLVDHLAAAFTNQYWTNTGPALDLHTGTVTDKNFVYMCIIAGAYLSVYRITSWYIGKADAGKIASKGIAVGGAAITTMVAGGMAAAGMLGKIKDPNLASIMNTASQANKGTQSIMEQD